MIYADIDYKISNTVLDRLLELANEESGYDVTTTRYSRMKIITDSPILAEDPLINYIKNNYSFVCMIFRCPPRYNVNYHVDGQRNFALNISLTEPASAFFADSDAEYYEKAMSLKKCPSFWNVRELKYNIGVPYVINTKVHHSILNLSDKNRYMLTCSFAGADMNDFKTDISSAASRIINSV